MTKTTDSYSFLLKKYLIFVNLCHITLSVNYSIKYAAVGAATSKPETEAIAFDENFFATPHQVT